MENAYMLLVSVSSEYSVLSKTAIATGVKTRGFGNPLGSDFLGTSNPTKSAKLVLEQFRAGEPPIRENKDSKSLTGILIFIREL